MATAEHHDEEVVRANPLATRAWCRQRLLQAPSRHAPGSYPEGDAGEHERGADQCLVVRPGCRRERPAPARGVPVVGAGVVGGAPTRVLVVLVPLWWSSWWWSSTWSAAVSEERGSSLVRRRDRGIIP
jgi:hypothetical protein